MTNHTGTRQQIADALRTAEAEAYGLGADKISDQYADAADAVSAGTDHVHIHGATYTVTGGDSSAS